MSAVCEGFFLPEGRGRMATKIRKAEAFCLSSCVVSRGKLAARHTLPYYPGQQAVEAENRLVLKGQGHLRVNKHRHTLIHIYSKLSLYAKL